MKEIKGSPKKFILLPYKTIFFFFLSSATAWEPAPRAFKKVGGWARFSSVSYSRGYDEFIKFKAYNDEEVINSLGKFLLGRELGKIGLSVNESGIQHFLVKVIIIE